MDVLLGPAIQTHFIKIQKLVRGGGNDVVK